MTDLPEPQDFPQLQEIAVPARLAQALQQHLGARLHAHGHHIASCGLDRIYHKPGAKCRLRIVARISDREGKSLGEQLYFGWIFSPGEGSPVFENARQKELLLPEFGDAIGFVPEWEMVIWAYPNDPNLAGIATLRNPQEIFDRVAAHPERFGIYNGYRPQTISARMAKYVPSKRCAYFYDLALLDQASGASKSHTIFGKTYVPEEGPTAFEVMAKIWQTEARQNGTFRMPEPYGYDHALNILWQENIPGRPIAKIAAQIDLAHVAHCAGLALAGYHNSALSFRQEHTIGFQLAQMRETIAAVKDTFPLFAATCAAYYDRLIAAHAGLPPVELVPVHGSFKFSHIFYDGKDVAFIDFDGANLGDPCYDLGRFIAYVCKLQADFKIDADTAQRTVENFCAAYHHGAQQTVARERINWFAGSHILTSQVYKAVKSLESNLISRLLRTADALCPV